MQTSQLAITVDFADVIGRPFYPVHNAIKRGKKSSFWLKGGRGSLKSSFVAIQIIRGIMKDPLANAVAIRRYGVTLRDSVLETLSWAIDKLQVSMLFRVTTSPAQIVYKPTGQKILMRGLDDPLKMKSLKVKKGYFKFLWFEEAMELDGPEQMRSVSQSVLRGGPEFIEFVTYNPPNDPLAWINDEYRKRLTREDTYCHHSTYLDVPADWLGPKFILDAQELERDNFLAYQHEYLGEEVGRKDAIIFGNNTIVRGFEVVKCPDGEYRLKDEPTMRPLAGPYYGTDFGFADDPGTAVKLWLDDTPGQKKRLFVEYEAHAYHVKLDALPEFYDQIPGIREGKLYGDSSRPETIAHIKDKGFDIEAAEKGEGSVQDGITYLQACDIIIHPRCKETQREARMYVFKVDRLTGEVTKNIVDKHNHIWDAVRYALWRIIKKRPKGFFS